jgi:hypothetical protein
MISGLVHLAFLRELLQETNPFVLFSSSIDVRQRDATSLNNILLIDNLRQSTRYNIGRGGWIGAAPTNSFTKRSDHDG